MKYFVNIFLILIFLILGFNCEQLPKVQNDALIQIIFEMWGEVVTINPACQYQTYKIFICELDSSNQYDVVSMNIGSPTTNNPTITSDLSMFPNLKNITIGKGISINNNFLKQLNQFQSLTSLKIDTFNGDLKSLITLPPSLKSVEFKTLGSEISPNWFSSNIETMTINQVVNGFAFPSTQMPINNHLAVLNIPISVNSFYANNIWSNFKKLTVLSFSIYIEDTSPIQVPTFTQMDSLSTLKFEFMASQYLKNQYLNFPSSINNLNSLQSIIFISNGFKIEDNGLIDFSNLSSGLNILFANSDLLSQCTQPPCLLVPQNSIFQSYSSFNMSNLDYSNYTSVVITSNTLEQKLPVKTIDFSKLSIFSVGLRAIGDIPVEYCKSNSTNLSLSNNRLGGYIPYCFRCLGGAKTPYLFSNRWTNFYPFTPSKCTSFTIESNYNKIAKTDGSSIIVVNGNDFGYNMYTNDNIKLTTTIENSQFQFPIVAGEGSTPLKYTVFFEQYRDMITNYTFEFTYEKPVITGFAIVNNQGVDKLQLNGTGFAYANYNNMVTFNDNIYNATKAINNYIGFQSNDNPISNLKKGDSFTVSVNVVDQVSNEIEFFYYKSIIVNEPTQTLNLTGGTKLIISGNFMTSSSKLTTVTINNLDCLVYTITSNFITIDYPDLGEGSYVLEVSFGNYKSSTIVKYAEFIIPTETPSTSTTVGEGTSTTEINTSTTDNGTTTTTKTTTSTTGQDSTTTNSQTTTTSTSGEGTTSTKTTTSSSDEGTTTTKTTTSTTGQNTSSSTSSNNETSNGSTSSTSSSSTTKGSTTSTSSTPSSSSNSGGTSSGSNKPSSTTNGPDSEDEPSSSFKFEISFLKITTLTLIILLLIINID